MGLDCSPVAEERQGTEKRYDGGEEHPPFFELNGKLAVDCRRTVGTAKDRK